MLRNILAVVAGVLVAGLLVAAVETVSNSFFPPAVDLSDGDMDALRAHVGSLPVTAFLMILFGWSLGAFTGGWLTERIAKTGKPTLSLVFAGVFLILIALNLFSIPHPIWMMVIGLLLPPAMAYAGWKIAARPGKIVV